MLFRSSMTSEQKPVILTNYYETESLTEGDCACPIAPLSNSLQPIESMLWKIPPSVYQTSLSDNHQLIFNYFGQTSLAVLNEPAHRIWNAFYEPINIDSIPEKIPSLIPNQAMQTAQHLVSLGLLVPAEKSYFTKQDNKPETLTVWLHVTNACKIGRASCRERV